MKNYGHSIKNYNFQLQLAGKILDIKCTNQSVVSSFKEYIYSSNDHDCEIQVSQSEIDSERRVINCYEQNGITTVTTDSDKSIEGLLVQRKIVESMLQFDTFLMHGSVVAKNNYAYMFTAPSGVGKTTRTLIWMDLYPDSIVVNGDKPLIKISPTQVWACGTPWSGKEGLNTNTMVALRAIFLLERADDGEKTTIEEISFGKAFPFLFQQIYRPEDPDMMRKTLSLLQSLEGKVRFYKFRSTPTEDAVQLAYETARP